MNFYFNFINNNDSILCGTTDSRDTAVFYVVDYTLGSTAAPATLQHVKSTSTFTY